MEKAHLKLTDLIKNDTEIITFLIGYYYSLSCYSKIWVFPKNICTIIFVFVGLLAIGRFPIVK